MNILNLFSYDEIIDFVILNDDLCWHISEYDSKGIKRVLKSFALPILCDEVKKEQKETQIVCPVCGKKYEEATKRLNKEYLAKKMEAEQESILDGGK